MDLVYEKQSPDGGMWGPLLEKVWAKTNGYYKRLENGIPPEAFDFLTGAPSTRYRLDELNVDAAFDLIHEADKIDHIITCATDGEGKHIMLNSFGLPKNHAYSLINTYTIKDKSGKVTNRLYMIRNPLGYDHGFWNGPWNDKDTVRWTEEHKKQVPFKN